MSRLELKLLGAPRVLFDGQEITLRTRKALALLAFLAAEGGMHRRDELAELLWPRSSGARRKTALRTALARIRLALREGTTGSENGFILAEGDRLGFGFGAGVELDLDVVQRASAVFRASSNFRETNRMLLPVLASADAAYRGEFMEGIELEDAPEFDLWMEGQRTYWRAQIGEVMGLLAELEAEAGEAAARVAERWVARDPAEGAARLRLVEARSAAGDSRGALAAYEEYRSELRQRGVDPDPTAESLAERVRAQIAAAAAEEERSPAGTPRMPFVGRKAEFGALVSEYRAARLGSMRAAVVVGEAGLGKTRLAEAFLGWAASQGADAVRGRTFETGARLPYELLVDALRPRVERERAPDDLLEDRWLAELSRILPELGDRYPDLPAPTSDEASARAVLFEALARLGAALAGGTGEPLVVFLDDLQWADGATLDVLGYVCRSWAKDGVPLLLLTTIREEDLDKNNLGRWLSSLGRELPVTRLRLAPMREKDVGNLLRLIAVTTGPDPGATSGGNSEQLARWLWEESEGHPLFLAQILDVLLDRGVLAEHVGPDSRRETVLSKEDFDEEGLRGLLPAGLRELIRDKVRPLSADASDVLTAGAVLGRSFGFRAMLRVADVGEGDGLPALDELVSARLLEESATPSAGAYSFAHDKIREVAYTEAGEARREVFHRRALKYLEDRGAPAAELARHALAAGFSEKAFGYLLAAAEEAMAVFAARDAVGYYDRAQNMLEDPSWRTRAVGIGERLRLYSGLAGARILDHDWARAQEAYEKMLAAAREGNDRESEWRALDGLAVLPHGLTWPEYAELLQGVRRRERAEGCAVTAAVAENGPEQTESRVTRGLPVVVGHRAGGYAEQALRLARDLGREDLISRSEFAFASSRIGMGLWEEAAPHYEEVRSLYASSDNREMEAHCLVGLWWCKSLSDGPPSAFKKYGRQAIEIRDASGSDHVRSVVGTAAQWLVAAGEYDDALTLGYEGLRAASSLGQLPYASWSRYGLGDAYREMFALQRAQATYPDLSGRMAFPAEKGIVHAKLCAVAALMGEWERARKHAIESFKLRNFQTRGPNDLHRHHDIEALLRGGDVDVARESLLNLKHRMGTQRGYFRLAYLRAEAVLTRWDGDTDETLSRLHEASALAERLGLPGETWQVATTLGKVHEERGEFGPSEQAFGRAAVVIRRLAANMKDENLREGFLSAPQTRRVLDMDRARETEPGFRNR